MGTYLKQTVHPIKGWTGYISSDIPIYKLFLGNKDNIYCIISS